MAASITTDHGTYTGRTVASIIRREFGRKAYVQWSPDPSRPTAGVILQRFCPRWNYSSWRGCTATRASWTMSDPSRGDGGPRRVADQATV